MPTTLVVPGVKILARPDEADKKAEDVFGVSIRTKSAVRVDTVTRGEVREVPIPVTDEEQEQGIIAELEFEDGLRQWIPVKTLRERLAQTERSYVRDDVVRIPGNISGQGTRGVGDWALKGFKLLDILLPQEAFDPATGPAARAIAAYYENRLKPEPGLYAIDRQGSLTKQPGNAPLPASDDPYLVLLHGTFSTTGSSFGRLIRSAEWMELSDVYSTRIVGLNHRTLSESPAQNALDLVKQLPAKARLHLLTHSRGGLAGELLALGPLPPDTLTSLELSGRPNEEIKALRELSDLLREKQVSVERFVRVACPARGTILASERLDRYLSVLLNLIGLIPAVDETLIYPFAKAAILSLIKQHTRPDELPGLEAMMPESPFIRLLNLQGVASSADLAVIAGDVEGSGLFGRLGVLAADLFYWQDHDLVVNTDSMFKGMAREAGIYYSYEKGPEITHFNYFKNDISRQRIKSWLVRKSSDPIPAGFQKLEGEPIPEIRRDLSRWGEPDVWDAVFLIPTLMGTHLRIGDKRIWLDLGRLGEGEFAKLRLDGGKDAVAVDEIATWGYGELINFLSERFDVIPFPYDWRHSLAVEGERLALAVEAELRKRKRPVHLLAHGAVVSSRSG